MPTLEQQLADLREKAAKAQAAAARGEAQREAAIAVLQAARKAIQDEFDVLPEDVPALLQQLEAEAAAEAARVREALAEAQE
jgi:regulator of protease activity HflC (stomatin/prohibitin superfamily)